MRAHPLDFVQVDFSVANRNAAVEVLPLAAARNIAVLVNMPFGGRREGNLLRKIGERRPLPPWAAELQAGSWAEILLKCVVSQPAVTCVIQGTTSVANLETNLRAARPAARRGFASPDVGGLGVNRALRVATLIRSIN